MRGILIMLMAIPNGSRAGEFVQLRFRHVQQAQPFRGGFHITVTIDAHKTAKWGRYAYFHLQLEEMNLLRRFSRLQH
ncbi:hypothetical protein DPMN_041934 [Dreissena polymorpha]|uniref:Uncharacterized protein n=1 Tax=Dreissena polymorpha TaxID=45954 RepID=A0A9D4CY46_DREPO|nr:hypothetical protein DPMN_041934 [Dreissena polymorpha]